MMDEIYLKLTTQVLFVSFIDIIIIDIILSSFIITLSLLLPL